MVDKFCFMVCENLKGEAQAVIECERLDDVALVIFPADCYRPNSKNERIAKILKDCKDKYDQVCLLGGGCIADAWEGFKALDSHRSLKVEQCANLFQSKSFIESYLKKGCYFLTPGWLDRWRHYITAWGFDRKTAQAFFKESASRLLLLDTGVGSGTIGHLKEFAEFAQLPFEVTEVGLDFFRLLLKQAVLEWRLEKATACTSPINSPNAADYAMTLDLVGTLTRPVTEKETVESIFNLFDNLFAPEIMVYLPVKDNIPGDILLIRSKEPPDIELTKARLSGFSMDYELTESGKGFIVRIGGQADKLGTLEIDNIAFPEYRERYLNLVLALNHVCVMAIRNSRTYERLEEAKRQIQEAKDKTQEYADIVRTSNRFLEIANEHTETTPLLQEFIQEVKGLTKCAAVGIRLLDEHGNIPYTAYTGFTRQFYEKENLLSIKADKCMCINVIKGDTDPRLSFYTENGSFYMNGTTRFLSTVSEKEKGETRNVCNAIGYESVALIPIRTDSRIVGLIHLADCAENMVPLGIVKQLEQASTALGIGIQRAQAEEALRRRTADLESSNKELESFAYSVSHDLRSPLRGIDGYSKILLDDYKGLLNKDGRFVLGEVRTAALEMGALIDDLLEYSRLGRCGLKQTTVDMNALFKEIFEEFQQTLQHRSLELDLGPLPVVCGDGTLLRSVVRNLVDNAVKFTEPRDTAIITVGTCDKPEPSSEFTFFVRDNGVGFDMRYAYKLFGVFQRLHTHGEFQGCGVGLANVKRIIERHGGRVWAEAEPDAGAVFYFTLPRGIQAAPVYRTADLHIIQSP